MASAENLLGQIGTVQVAQVATQTAHPWRATVRSTVWGLLAALAILPTVATVAGLDPAVYPWVGGFLAVTAAVTRVANSPAVTGFIRARIPWLAPAPPAELASTEVPVVVEVVDGHPVTVPEYAALRALRAANPPAYGVDEPGPGDHRRPE